MKRFFYKMPFPLMVLGFAVLGTLVVAGIGYVAMLLWNALMPEIFGLVSLSFWQALGLLVLVRMFFGGLGHGHSNHSKRGPHSKNQLFEKWRVMSPEERREFMERRHAWHARQGEWNPQTDCKGNG
jgi:hypothetical protein